MCDENDDFNSSSYSPSIVSKNDEPKKVVKVTEPKTIENITETSDEKACLSFKDMVIPGEIVEDEHVTESSTKTHQNILPIQTKVNTEPCNLPHEPANESIENNFVDEVAQFQLDPHHNYDMYTYTPKF